MPIQVGSTRGVKAPGEPLVKKDALFQEYAPRYPDGIDLSPGEKVHELIKNEVLLRARESEVAINSRSKEWDVIDKNLRAFIDLTDQEKDLQDIDASNPVSIVIPESYATLETFVTYMMTVFGDTPRHKLDPTGPEDLLGTIILEKLLDIQHQKAKILLATMEQWRDSYAYGFGVVALSWTIREGRRSRTVPITDFDVFGNPVVIGQDRIVEDAVLYEGAEVKAIDPRHYLPDPAVSIFRPQNGEYVGWLSRDQHFMSLRRDESGDGSIFFNVKYLDEGGMKGHRSAIFTPTIDAREAEGSYRETQPRESTLTNQVDVIWMYVDLIPEDWELGDGQEPEKWLFALANDNVVIAAHPMNLNHGMFPVAVCAPDMGGHEAVPVSKMEIMAGFQLLVNWYVNTHVEEVDRFKRNSFIIDPGSVNMASVKANRGIFFTRKSMWKRGVDNVMKQLPMQDVTQAHMADMQTLSQFSRNLTGAQDSLLGIQRQRPERVTRGEFEQTRNAALSRLQKGARVISLQSNEPMGEMMAMHTQQFMSQETFVKTTGRWEDVLREEYGIHDPFIPVSPFDIDVMFDVTVQDGSVLGGESPSDWMQFFQIAMSNPETLQGFDFIRMATHIARLMGNKNPEDFRKKGTPQINVQSDQAVQESVQAGNAIPFEEALQQRGLGG